MKIRIVICLLSFLFFLVTSFSVISPILDEQKELKRLNAEYNETQSKQEDVKSQINNLYNNLESAGKLSLLNNGEVAASMANLKGATLTNITAERLLDGEYVEILSTDNPDDVSFFTDTIDVVRYDYNIKDLDTFLTSLQGTILILEQMELDADSKSVSIRVATSSKLYLGEEDTSEVKVEDTEETLDGSLNM